jgi:alpha-1,4-digalacturonate transport system substrate-binding protein
VKNLRLRAKRLTAVTAALAAMSMLTAHAADLRVQCYSDGNECEVTGEIAKRFEAANPGTKIIIDKVPYNAVVETTSRHT